MDLIVIRDFAIALFIGALIGIEREKRKMDEDAGLGGIRTFILLSMAGAASGWLSSQLGSPWIFAVTLLLAVSFVIAGYTLTVHSGAAEPGLTTEIAALVTVLLGGLVMFGWPGLAVGLGVTTAAVLDTSPPKNPVSAVPLDEPSARTAMYPTSDIAAMRMTSIQRLRGLSASSGSIFSLGRIGRMMNDAMRSESPA